LVLLHYICGNLARQWTLGIWIVRALGGLVTSPISSLGQSKLYKFIQKIPIVIAPFGISHKCDLHDSM